MALYTILFEYRGGTYVDQVRARSPYEALQKWAPRLDYSKVDFMGKARHKSLCYAVADPVVTPVQQVVVQNVWRWADLIKGELAMVHIVKTET